MTRAKLIAFGFSPTKAAEILLNARRGDKMAKLAMRIAEAHNPTPVFSSEVGWDSRARINTEGESR